MKDGLKHAIQIKLNCKTPLVIKRYFVLFWPGETKNKYFSEIELYSIDKGFLESKQLLKFIIRMNNVLKTEEYYFT